MLLCLRPRRFCAKRGWPNQLLLYISHPTWQGVAQADLQLNASNVVSAGGGTSIVFRPSIFWVLGPPIKILDHHLASAAFYSKVASKSHVKPVT